MTSHPGFFEVVDTVGRTVHLRASAVTSVRVRHADSAQRCDVFVPGHAFYVEASPEQVLELVAQLEP